MEPKGGLLSTLERSGSLKAVNWVFSRCHYLDSLSREVLSGLHRTHILMQAQKKPGSKNIIKLNPCEKGVNRVHPLQFSWLVKRLVFSLGVKTSIWGAKGSSFYNIGASLNVCLSCLLRLNRVELVLQGECGTEQV